MGVATRSIVCSLVAAAAIAVCAGVQPQVAAAATTPNCGFYKPPKSTGGTWQCSFSDDFTGTTLDRAKWLPQRTDTSGYTDGMSCYMDSPNNVAVSGGTLKLTVRKEAAPFTCTDPRLPAGSFPTQYTSGMVSTWGLFSQAYGRFQVRARISPVTSIKGLQSSLWLWPKDNGIYGPWPTSGEIDFAEIFSSYPNHVVPYIHYNAADPGDPNVTNTNCVVYSLGSFHNYTVEWTPESIKVIYDNRTCLTDYWSPASPLTHPQPFDQPFIVALTQSLGVGNNAFDPATTPLPAKTEIDYVRVWK